MNVSTNRGVILLTVLWSLVILTVVALGIGRQAQIELALTKHSIERSQARFLALAGFQYALAQIREDSLDPVASRTDTLAHCGVIPREETDTVEMFKNVDFKSGQVEIGYVDEDRWIYGLSDEERRINLNALTSRNIDIFVHLLEILEVESEEARHLAHAVLDWMDSNDAVSHEEYGAESEYYQDLKNPLRAKNLPLESLEELLLVKGMNEEIFERIRPYVTIYPSKSQMRINFNTASQVVIDAVARSFTGSDSNTDVEDARSLAAKIIDYRNGDDGQAATEDDRLVDIEEIAVNQKEKVIYQNMRLYKTDTSNYLRIHVRGRDNQQRVTAEIEAIVFRNDLSVVYWRRS